MKILVVNGPNLNLLGTREPDTYGKETLKDIIGRLKKTAEVQKSEIYSFQSNHEGELVDFIQSKGQSADYLIINPAAFTHTSVALRDAVLSVGIKTIEIHISNIFSREPFRHKSYISDIAECVISGMGTYGYDAALDFILQRSVKS
jgi:3-dehydroquinate dehydratase-2